MESGCDSEYEEEEMIVLAELQGLVDEELLTKGCTYQFVGIDTDKPVLQLGKYNFLGSYEDQIGSALFLQQSTDEAGRKTWSKMCFSDKKLSMQRVFLRKKGEEPPKLPCSAAEEESTAEQGKEKETESSAGQEKEQDMKSETLSETAENRQERTVDPKTDSAEAAGGGSDVEMIPVDGSEPPSETQNTASDPPTGSNGDEP